MLAQSVSFHSDDNDLENGIFVFRPKAAELNSFDHFLSVIDTIGYERGVAKVIVPESLYV